MEVPVVRDNLARVRDEIDAILSREGLGSPVRIIGVTKGHGPDAVQAAAAAGLTDVGENRVREARGKQDALPDTSVAWHLIGHRQTNKAKLVAGRFAMVHSVDSMRLADAVARAGAGRGAPVMPVLLQVNVAGESQKNGCDPAEASELARHVEALPELKLRGLMTMAPFTDDEPQQRAVFAGLRAVRERLEAEGLELPELSMGMSGDYRAAVAEGATMVRLGTVLFGERRP